MHRYKTYTDYYKGKLKMEQAEIDPLLEDERFRKLGEVASKGRAEVSAAAARTAASRKLDNTLCFKCKKLGHIVVHCRSTGKDCNGRRDGDPKESSGRRNERTVMARTSVRVSCFFNWHPRQGECRYILTFYSKIVVMKKRSEASKRFQEFDAWIKGDWGIYKAPSFGPRDRIRPVGILPSQERNRPDLF